MSISNHSPVKGCSRGRGPGSHAGRWGLMGVLWAASAAVPGASWAQQQAAVVYRCPGPPVLYTDTLTPQEAKSRNCKPLTDLPVAVSPPPAPRPAAVAGGAAVGTPSGVPGGGAAVGTAPGAGSGGVPAASGTGLAAGNAPGSSAAKAATGGGFVTPPPGGSRLSTPGSGAVAGAAAATAGAPAGAGAGTGIGTSSGAAPAAALPAPSVGSQVVAVDTRVRPDDQRSRDAEARRILEAELRREEARLNEAVKASSTAKPGERVGADAAQIRRAESDIEAIRRELGRLR